MRQTTTDVGSPNAFARCTNALQELVFHLENCGTSFGAVEMSLQRITPARLKRLRYVCVAPVAPPRRSAPSPAELTNG